MLNKRNISKIAMLIILITIITASIGAQMASAGYLVKQYYMFFADNSYNPQYSGFFTSQ